MASKPGHQLVRYLFLKLRPEWRQLDLAEQEAHKEEFGLTLKSFHGKLLLRTYSLAGTRGDCDMMLWQVAEDLETLQAVETVVFSTSLGGYLETPYSYIGMMKQSAYGFPKVRGQEGQTTIAPSDSRYLFVYPFVKKRDWYALPLEQRQAAMNDHVRIGRRYPSVRINTVHSFGLDDQEFMVAFEADDPGDFVDLIMELRESEASAYTERDVPVFTCIQMSIWEMLDTLGGASLAERAEAVEPDADGFVPVAELDELPVGHQ